MSRAIYNAASADVNNLSRQILNSYQSQYFTLLSIVQGTALIYYLRGRVLEHVLQLAMGSAGFYVAVTTLAVIIGVWNEYRVAATVHSWYPWLLDTIYPFAIGIAEISLVRSVGTYTDDREAGQPTIANGDIVSWLGCMSVVWLIGALAYMHTAYQSSQSQGHKGAGNLVRQYVAPAWSGVACFVIGAFHFAVWYTSSSECGSGLVLRAMASCLVAIAYLFVQELAWCRFCAELRRVADAGSQDRMHKYC